MAEEKKNKLTSRKFIVWLVWVLITIMIFVLKLVLKDNNDELIVDVLKYLFGVSMLYLGVNAGQKVGTTIAENLKGADENECSQ